ncbi:CdaR family transcriptional regulator [Oceanobacillus bengalensis]|uniref:Transcriptional regulator n=1 Tax=Oceanobacillus bengalensis TaxID=1435466 RepID=A0A494YWY4_9BACI|nr:sugar diacid recognition domain-containing protein [Oceanobacillus bengalensis]RKQ14620.1 hypothetical protein D8M05_12320 [Oceanobacillus bengalensis]
MNDLVQFAQKVVDAVSNIVPFPISLSDEDGYIIGSTIPNRIGTLHTPSKEVLDQNAFIYFDEIKIINMENVLPGVAAPLVFNNKPIGVLGIIGPPDQVKPYAYLIKKHVEMTWQEIISWQTEDLRLKTLEAFAQYILLNDTLNREKIERQSKMFEIQYEAKRFCIVIDIEEALLNTDNSIQIDSVKQQLVQCVSTAFDCKADFLCTFLNSEKIILLKSVKDEEEYELALKQFRKQSNELLKMFRSYHILKASIAIGNLQPTIEKINQSFQEAVGLIECGKKANISPKIYSFHDSNILLELLPAQINSAFLNKLTFFLKAFIENENFTELAKTFIGYCEADLNISKAAKELFIHRNTLIYRLQKIEDITSLNTKHFKHCTMLYLILKHNGIHQ